MARLVPSLDIMDKDIKTEITDNASIRYCLNQSSISEDISSFRPNFIERFRPNV